MPKVRPLMWSPAPQCDALRRNIKICMLKTGTSPDELAKLLNVCRASVYNKIKDPQKIQFEELCRIAHIFNVEVVDLVKEGGV